MSIKTQIKKELKALERYEVQHRSGFERTSTLVLTLATLFSLTGLGHDDQRAARRAAIVPTVPILSSTEKNETVRMPIKFDDGLRAIANTGQ